MVDRKSWFALAQIFAILSGTWIVGAALFASQSSNLSNEQMGFLSLGVSCKQLNNSICLDSLINASGHSMEALKGSIKIWLTLFGLAIFFALLSLFFWFIGIQTPEK